MMKRALGRGLNALVPDTYKSEQSVATAVITEQPQTAILSSGVIELDVTTVRPNQSQPRHYFSEHSLDELAQSIKEKGILQPIIVKKTDTHSYEIICGERRYRAAMKAGLTKIPVIIKDIVDADALEIALVENIQREDLNPIEEANAYARLQESRKYSQEDIAAKVGKDRTTIANALRILKLPPDILDLVVGKKIAEGHARALLAIPTEEYQRNMARRIVDENLSVRQTEKLIQQQAFKKRRMKEARKLDAEIIHLETLLQQKLGTRVRIFAGKNNKGRLEIQYKSLDEFDRILNTMGVYQS